ncbi:MAG: SDR family NAD(P)-dependent oxidoreductase [Spirochaetales bacterium]
MNKRFDSRIPLLRGALCRYGPAPTLLVSETDDPREASKTVVPEDAVLAGVELPDGANAVSESASQKISDHVKRTGSIPRELVLSDGTTLRTGATLSGFTDRACETLLASEAIVGREAVVTGRVAVVTGGAQGFGEQLVRGLVANGALVFIADLNLDGAKKLSAELNAAQGEVTYPLAVDISNEESVETLFAEVVARAGGLDLFVANAGVLKAGSVKELTAKDFGFVTSVNYNGFFLCVKHGAQVMAVQNASAPKERMTDIIQINSKSGLTGSNRNGAYAGSKFGGIGLVQSFALELVEDRIKVNAICPGNFLDGPLWSDPDRGLFVQYLRAGKVPGAKSIADVRAAYEAKVPIGRGCTGEDVMRALLYIVEQQYETGQAVPVTGGQNMLA